MDRLTSSFALYPGRFREWWNTQTSTNRIVYSAIGVVIALALGFLLMFRLHGPAYGVLFSNLQPDEMSAVVQKLEAAKIPHRLADGGATVLVPQENVYEERVALAGEGVVKAAAAPASSCSTRPTSA